MESRINGLVSFTKFHTVRPQFSSAAKIIFMLGQIISDDGQRIIWATTGITEKDRTTAITRVRNRDSGILWGHDLFRFEVPIGSGWFRSELQIFGAWNQKMAKLGSESNSNKIQIPISYPGHRRHFWDNCYTKWGDFCEWGNGKSRNCSPNWEFSDSRLWPTSKPGRRQSGHRQFPHFQMARMVVGNHVLINHLLTY